MFDSDKFLYLIEAIHICLVQISFQYLNMRFSCEYTSQSKETEEHISIKEQKIQNQIKCSQEHLIQDSNQISIMVYLDSSISFQNDEICPNIVFG